MTSPAPETPDRRVPRARYGVSHRLGEVEYLDVRFAGHRFAPHSHPVFALGAVRVGACTIWHRGVAHTARPGDLVLFNPGEPHSADQVGGETWDYCAVYVSRASLESWLPAHGAGVRLGGVVGHAPELAAELTSICHRLGDDPESARVETRFARFVRAIFAEFGDSTPHDEYAGESDSVWSVREYLDACYARPIRLEELAAISGTSTFALIRSFSRAFGMPPYRYLTNLRIARAQELLRLGRPISDTAFSTGFSDQAHFTRFFRRIVGVPPGVWARGVGRVGDAPPSAPVPERRADGGAHVSGAPLRSSSRICR